MTDPSVQTQKAAGLKHSRLALLHPKAAWNYARATCKGFIYLGGIKGDDAQQGGLLVVGKDGEVLFFHRDETGGEVLPLDRALAALP